jgi:hypothetical protein
MWVMQGKERRKGGQDEKKMGEVVFLGCDGGEKHMIDSRRARKHAKNAAKNAWSHNVRRNVRRVHPVCGFTMVVLMYAPRI